MENNQELSKTTIIAHGTPDEVEKARSILHGSTLENPEGVRVEGEEPTRRQAGFDR